MKPSLYSGMRSLVLIVSVLFGVLLHVDTPADQIDRILVIVNDDVVIESEYEERYRTVLRELRGRRDGQLPPENVLRRQILERMITEKIQLQRAERLGVKVSDSMVDQAFRSLATTNNMSIEQFQRALVADGLSVSSVRGNLREQLTIRSLVEQDVIGRVIVSDEEIDTFLAGPAARSATREFRLSHILIRVPESASAEDQAAARRRIEEAQEQLRSGRDFGQVAAVYSQAQDALEGGVLGWRKPGQLPSLFLEALNRINPGETTEVIRSPNGFHILKLEELRGAGASQLTQSKVRHILIKTDDFITVAEASRRLTQLRERIVNGEDFASLALAHSDDTVSSAKGGDLGWIMPGDTVRPFEEAMDNLQAGQISEPVRTPFGVHLIQVLERKDISMSGEVDRANARQQLRARKVDERYEQWIQRLRDESYIELLKAVS